MNGLGRDAVFIGVKKDCDYALKQGEYLLINYTNSTTDSAGNSVKSVVNEILGEKTIIKPNFDLCDSSVYSGSHSYSKKNNFYFNSADIGGANIEGMFTLGTSEQICVESLVNVELKGACNLYWELASDDTNSMTNT